MAGLAPDRHQASMVPVAELAPFDQVDHLRRFALGAAAKLAAAGRHETSPRPRRSRWLSAVAKMVDDAARN